MAIIKAKARQSTAISRVAEGEDAYLRALRDGALIVADWRQALILEGRGFMIQVGALTTPIVGGGNGTIIDLDQPEVNIGIPGNTTIIPIRIHVQCEVPADTDADIEEIILGMDTLATNTGGTFTDETAVNLRTLASRATLCDPNSAYTVNQTTEPTVIELARAQTVTNVVTSGITNKQFELLYEPRNPLLITGPAQLLVYWGGVAAMSGFAQVYWLELPSSYFS